MNNIAPSEGKIPPCEEPLEFCPIQLYWLVSHQFQWDLHQFALAYGWDVGTIQKWMYHVRPPSKKARVTAFLLKKEWGL